MKKALVTGANGFVGGAVCRALSDSGVTVVALLKSERSDDSYVRGIKNVRIEYCDIDSYSSLPDIICDRDIDCVYHFAWAGCSGPLRGDADIQIRNILGACNLLQASVDINCHRFIFAGSIMEYEISILLGKGIVPPINTLYDQAKLTADRMLKTISQHFGIEYICGLISNIYGPGEISQRLINSSIRKLLLKEHCSFSEGKQLYDFIYIDDAAKAFVLMGTKGLPGKLYYVGSGKPRPLREFLIEMRDAVDPSAQIGLGEIPYLGQSLTYEEFDVDALNVDTGFLPQTDFVHGIKATKEWLSKRIKNNDEY